MPPLAPELQQTIRHQRPIHQPRPLARILSQQPETAERGEVVPEAQTLVERHAGAKMHKDDMALSYAPRQQGRPGRPEEPRKVALDESDGGRGGGVDASPARGADSVTPKGVERERQGIKEEPVPEGVLRVYP